MGCSMKTKPPLTVDGAPRAFFGRRSGKTLHARQQLLFDNLLPDLSIDLPEGGALDPDGLFQTGTGPLILEIGYGGGEHLARQAEENPDSRFIGCEVFTGGIGKLLEKIAGNDLSNIRLYADDALKLLQTLPDAVLDGVYLLYPDPWPKLRHHKRRFVSPTTLAELARVIKPGGFFRFASDIEDYANWTLAHILHHPDFDWVAGAPESWHVPYPGWQPTRYEQKARREGRLKSFYFSFTRHGPTP